MLPEGTDALGPFVDAGVLHEADVQVAGAVARTVPGTTDDVLLATALCVRALRFGHVCIQTDRVAATVTADSNDDDPDSIARLEDAPLARPGGLGRLPALVRGGHHTRPGHRCRSH